MKKQELCKGKEQEQEDRTMKGRKLSDRHSKIVTARGVRDRRIRLSVETSLKFFGIQERLGSDKPSQTVDWLIHNSHSAFQSLPCISSSSTATTPFLMKPSLLSVFETNQTIDQPQDFKGNNLPVAGLSLPDSKSDMVKEIIGENESFVPVNQLSHISWSSLLEEDTFIGELESYATFPPPSFFH